MKKNLLSILLIGILIIGITGCDKKEESKDNSTNNEGQKETSKSSNYGKVVKNYTANEQEWKVFYENEENGRIYLITSGFVHSKYLANSYKNGASNWEGGYSETRIYNYEWNDSTKVNLEEQNRHDELFMATKYKLNAEYKSSRAVSTLLNTGNWTDFVDKNYAEYAIGGPTIELFAASYNSKHPDDKLYIATNEYGYYVGLKENPTDFFTLLTNDELYFLEYDEEATATGYWIASPSANDLSPGNRIIRASYDGNLNFSYPSDATYGVRPVVVLKEGIKIEENSDGTVSLK